MKSYQLSDAPTSISQLKASHHHVFGSLSSTMFIEIFEPKERIITYTQPISNLRFMIKGKAKISWVHENGNQSIVHFVFPEEYLGELTFLDIEKEHKNIDAISQCVFLSIPMSDAKRILRNDSKFLYTLSQFIGNKMLQRTHFNAKNQNYELKNRLAAYILATEHNDLYTEKHVDTAEYLAVSYRHLLHTFKYFLDEGLLIKRKEAIGSIEHCY